MTELDPATQAPVRDHAFDGIQEYDNNLPKWWLNLFFGSILFACWYVPHYHFGGAPLGVEKLHQEQLAEAERRAAAGGGALTEDGLRGISRSPERIAKGAALWTQCNCAQCHGPEGTGLTGPNLRDRYWINGSSMLAIADVITNGRIDRGMPSQMKTKNLTRDDVANLTIMIVDWARQGERSGKAIDPAREQEAPITY